MPRFLPPSLDLSGRTALITGANSGLGYECARQLLSHKLSTLIIGVRSVEKGNSAREALLADPKIQKFSPEILVKEIDLASYDSVRAFAAGIGPRLDIAILNAGITLISYAVASPGNEMQLQVNYLSNALLSLLLLPTLRRTSKLSGRPSRLTFVSSEMHKSAQVHPHALAPNASIISYLNDKANFKGVQRYGITKLLVTLWTRELAEKVAAGEVIINSVCPGFVGRTGLDGSLPVVLKSIMLVVRGIKGKSVEEGASHLGNAAVVAGEETHGEFLSNYVITRYPSTTTDGKATQKKLWTDTMAELGAVEPKCESMVTEVIT